MKSETDRQTETFIPDTMVHIKHTEKDNKKLTVCTLESHATQVTPTSALVYSLPIHVLLILDRYLKLLRHIADIITLQLLSTRVMNR